MRPRLLFRPAGLPAAKHGDSAGAAVAGRQEQCPGLSRSQAADRAWILTGVELYLAATDGCGWSDTAYAEWLSGLLISELLTPGR